MHKHWLRPISHRLLLTVCLSTNSRLSCVIPDAPWMRWFGWLVSLIAIQFRAFIESGQMSWCYGSPHNTHFFSDISASSHVSI